MRRTIIILVGVLLAVIALVVVTFVVVLNQPPPSYMNQNTPEAVANDYVLATINNDYPVIYQHLSPTLPGYPASEEALQNLILTSRPYDALTGAGYRIDVDASSEQRFVYSVSITQVSNGGLFGGTPYTNRYRLHLRNINGDWKVVDGDYPLFYPCLLDTNRCR